MHVPPERVFFGSPAIVVLQDSEPAVGGGTSQPRTGGLFSEWARTVRPEWIVNGTVLARRIVLGLETKLLRKPADRVPDEWSKPSDFPQEPPADLVIEYWGRGPVGLAVHKLEGGVSQLDQSLQDRIGAIQFEADIGGGCRGRYRVQGLEVCAFDIDLHKEGLSVLRYELLCRDAGDFQLFPLPPFLHPFRLEGRPAVLAKITIKGELSRFLQHPGIDYSHPPLPDLVFEP